MGYLLMLLSAFGLGAAHALEPGHGKTVVAAYLVGARGRAVDAVLLGAVVTATHTFSVFVLAVGSILAASYFVSAEVQRACAIGSGVLVTAVGVWMIYVRTKHGPPAHSHSDGGHHPHHHDHGHGHERGHEHVHQEEEAEHVHHEEELGAGEGRGLRIGPLVALGVSGGIVPCPAALLLIPAAMGTGEMARGVVLVGAFSLGLALVLMAVGLATLKAAGFASRWVDRGDWARRVAIASAWFITLLGLALTIKAVATGSVVH
ncbi:MAG: sulfite exporter TauE/SafE family protein [Armatimonadota bacterium]|nr:sulfite exporter TauE/SafE family protein [Armatimonadota bacterium]